MTTDVGAMIRTHRKRRFKYRSDAAKLIMIDRGGVSTHMSREGLRRLEANLNLPSGEVLNQMISKWGLDLAEAENLRRAVHVQRQLRDGYVQPTAHDPLGQDVESLICSTTGEIVKEMKLVLEELAVEESAEILQDLHDICDCWLRASFR